MPINAGYMINGFKLANIYLNRAVGKLIDDLTNCFIHF